MFMPAIAGAAASRPVAASQRRPGGSFLGDSAGFAAFDRNSPYGGAQRGDGLVPPLPQEQGRSRSRQQKGEVPPCPHEQVRLRLRQQKVKFPPSPQEQVRFRLLQEQRRFGDCKLGGRSFQHRCKQSGQSYDFHWNVFPALDEESELRRENTELKDSVDRLRMELKEAVWREQHWKHRCAQQNFRHNAETPCPGPAMRAAYWSEGCSYHENDMPAAPSQNQHAGQPYQHGVPQNAVQEDMHSAAGREKPAANGSSINNLTLEFRSQRQSAPTMPDAGCADLMADGMSTMQAGEHRAPLGFHASRPAPDALNEGGFFTLSSMSSQIAPPLPHDSPDCDESDDSGMLPQPPEKLYFRPPNVPCLDGGRLQGFLAREAEAKRQDIQALVEHGITISL